MGQMSILFRQSTYKKGLQLNCNVMRQLGATRGKRQSSSVTKNVQLMTVCFVSWELGGFSLNGECSGRTVLIWEVAHTKDDS